MAFFVPFLALLGVCYAIDGSVLDATGCPVVFEGKCTCGMETYKYWRPSEQLYIVNCTNTGFQNTSMLQLLPEQTQVLIFVGNNITYLDWNQFGNVYTRDDFEVIDFSNNKIQEILGKAFHHVPNVKRLVLNHNDLRISGTNLHKRILTNFYNLEELHLTNAFTELIDSKWYLDDLKQIFITSKMDKLYNLHLEQNEICINIKGQEDKRVFSVILNGFWKFFLSDNKNITKDLFCSLPGLKQLYLGDNQLNDIDFNLECLGSLQHLDLRFNKIKTLPNKTLSMIDAVFEYSKQERKIDLYGNPFVCDCHMRNFYDWLSNTTSIYEKERLACDTGLPEVNAGRKIFNVLRFECPEISHHLHSGDSITHSSTQALLIVLIILIIILIALVALVNKNKIRSHLSPHIANLKKSMEYRTIEKSSEIAEVNV